MDNKVQYPLIDKDSTSQRLKYLMRCRNISVKDIQEYLGLACVQSIYHWLNGLSLPSVDNLYALSELFEVPMDTMIKGNRKFNYHFGDGFGIRIMTYYRMVNKGA